MKKILNYIDFGFKKTDIIPVLALILCIIAIKIFNVTEIYENSILENLQLIPLFLGAVFCFTAKNNKNLYIIVALILILLFLRELSYGRVLYGAIPGSPHDFYPLSHFKYGYLTNIIIGIYLISIFVFGIIKNVWRDIFEIVRNIKLPIWTLLFTFIFIVFEIFGEKFDNTIIEEISELVIYCYIFSLCLIYLNKTNKIKKDE